MFFPDIVKAVVTAIIFRVFFFMRCEKIYKILNFFKAEINVPFFGLNHPILDTRFSVHPCVTLRVPPLDSETGWTGDSNRVSLHDHRLLLTEAASMWPLPAVI